MRRRAGRTSIRVSSVGTTLLDMTLDRPSSGSAGTQASDQEEGCLRQAVSASPADDKL